MEDIGLKLPQWWNERIAAAWSRVHTAALEDWRVRGDHSIPQESSIVEHALAFGHGARSAFPRATTWPEVRVLLRADWVKLGNVGTAAWDQVSEIIHHEWLRASGPGGDAEPIATTPRNR